MLNAIRGEAERVLRQRADPRFGVIDGVDPANHTARVRFQPEDTLSGWLPVMALSVGNGWGLHALPAVGAQVVVGFQEGGAEAGFIMGGFYSQQQRPPGTPAGSIWLTSEAGARVKINQDGTLEMSSEVLAHLTSAVLAKVSSEAMAQVLAPTVQLGASGGPFLALLTQAAASVFNTHTHAGGPAPTQQMGAGVLTTNVGAT